MFYFKQKTAYELLISYWSPYICSSDLDRRSRRQRRLREQAANDPHNRSGEHRDVADGHKHAPDQPQRPRHRRLWGPEGRAEPAEPGDIAEQAPGERSVRSGTELIGGQRPDGDRKSVV